VEKWTACLRAHVDDSCSCKSAAVVCCWRCAGGWC